MLEFQYTDDAAVNQGNAFLIYSASGVGKTTLAATLPPAETLIISAEAGLLALKRHKIPALIVTCFEDFQQALDMAKSSACDWAKNIYVDSLSEIAEKCLSADKKLTKDPRQAYGSMADTMIEYAKQFRDIPRKNKFLLAKEEFVQDANTGVLMYGPSMPGKSVGPALPYLFDEVFRLIVATDPTTKSIFRCIQTGPDLQTKAKDRSGELDMYEPFVLDPATKMPIPGTGLANILTKINS